MANRMDKVNDLIRDEISKMLPEVLDDASLGFITVTYVKTSADLHYADVWVSILSDDQDATFKFLESVTYKIQRLLNDKLRMKYVPKITFKLDLGGENVDRVAELIDQLKTKD